MRHCYRCDTVVEPRLSDQWFVKMEPLAKPALKGVRDGTIRILPERWEAVYVNWLENIRDWNISRQLWWGHRIPVWYCDKCNKTIGAAPTSLRGQMPRSRSPGEDVLDTGLVVAVPISTLGGRQELGRAGRILIRPRRPDHCPRILFFWSREDHGRLRFMDATPPHVYLHGTVRDWIT